MSELETFVGINKKDESMAISKDADSMITASIVQIDKFISNQLNKILHHPDFQKLEASWRGLNYLVSNTNTGERLKIKVLNVTKKDLIADLKQSKKYDKSELFKKVYEDVFGTPLKETFGTLIGDYEFSNHSQDILLLKKISEVAASAHSPFISAAAPGLLNMKSYTELSNGYEFETIFGKPEYAAWRAFRESEDSRYVFLTLPHTLMRLPYGKDTVVVDSLAYEEEVDGKDHSKYLWGNAAYSLGVRITKAFDKHSWCVAIRGVEGGGLVQDLPSHPFKTDEGDIALKGPTEINITDRREKELADLGFIPLCYYKNTDNVAFFSLQSTNKPKQYTTDAPTANLSSQLQYIFTVSRFAHYFKSMMRDRIDGFMSLEEVGNFLNNWIEQYVCVSDSSESYKKKCPLNNARIDVLDIPGKPGVYKAVAFLQPHFQLDELISLRLVTELPTPIDKSSKMDFEQNNIKEEGYMSESVQHKIDTDRAPRVHLTYDVEIGDATKQKEIPFVVGVLADLSGNPKEPLPKLKDRKFAEIDSENFDDILKGVKPRLSFKVKNTLQGDGKQLAVDIDFKSIDDFHPENIVKQITPLEKLRKLRQNLSDLRTNLDGNDTLDELLQDVVSDTEKLNKLATKKEKTDETTNKDEQKDE